MLGKRQQSSQGEPINALGQRRSCSRYCCIRTLAWLWGISSRYVHADTLHSGGTNKALDLQDPDNNLGAQGTDNGLVLNLKWSFPNSKTRLYPEGWTREQVGTDLPASKEIAAVHLHLSKGALRELHWH